MGDWSITIRGTGVHHNGDRLPNDANRAAARFVRELRATQTIHAATFATAAMGPNPSIPEPGRFFDDLLDPAAELGTAPRVAPFDTRSFGHRAFDAYREKRGGKNHDGTPTPIWDELTQEVRDGWEAAAAAVLGS